MSSTVSPTLEEIEVTTDDIRALLATAQLTQAAAAAYLRVDPRTVRNYVAGKTAIPYPHLFLLQVLAEKAEQDGVSDDLIETLIDEDEEILRELAK